jgi:hypothetical protein
MTYGERNGSTRAWRRQRMRVILAAEGRCQIQIEGICLGIATQAHHTRPWAPAVPDEWLLAACWPCNRALGQPEDDPAPTPLTTW